MRSKKFFAALSLLIVTSSFGQVYDDYIGGDHIEGVTISSSETTTGNNVNTLNGEGLIPDLEQASRFLSYVSLGYDYEKIQEVAFTGIEGWVDAQLVLPPEVSFTDSTWMVWDHFWPQYVEMYGLEETAENINATIPYWFYWKMAWWNNVMSADDLLRQRVAQAYSQIFVISQRSDLELSGPGLANYYDVLYNNAFGNYKDLLREITLHPAMGMYLSHINNPKAIPELNIHSDENYAREIMQLFSIGLFELNQDGSYVLDDEDQPIPTYDYLDIREFAKIFTGLGPAGYYWPWEDYSLIPVEWNSPFNYSPAIVQMWEPMQPFEEWHQQGPKILLNGEVVPDGQSTLEDIDSAIDNLFNHPNVGPFIGRLLIQRLVKSNPTPEYINRVADAFADNGDGVRGDMGAVIKAIITDEEAIDCYWIDQPESGRLTEPMFRYTHPLMAFNPSNESGKLWNVGYLFEEAVSQGILTSPSVFNFYLPDFQPNGEIANAELVAPEFEILTDATAINYANTAYVWFLYEFYMEVITGISPDECCTPYFEFEELETENLVTLDYSDEIEIADDPAALVNRLDLILARGQLSEESKEIIATNIADIDDLDYRVRGAIYMILISPDFAIIK